MSFGKMQTIIEIYETIPIKDREGFVTKQDNLLAMTRAYKEDRHGNEAWKNRASFTSATSLFRFRKPRHFDLNTKHEIVCKGKQYNIVSVEDILERGMYVEVLAESMSESKG